MMTRKNYEAIAHILKTAKNSPIIKQPFMTASSDSYEAVALIWLWSIEEELANYMEDDNPNFQRTRFMEACRGT
jgi:hypothetical protein